MHEVDKTLILGRMWVYSVHWVHRIYGNCTPIAHKINQRDCVSLVNEVFILIELLYYTCWKCLSWKLSICYGGKQPSSTINPLDHAQGRQDLIVPHKFESVDVSGDRRISGLWSPRLDPSCLTHQAGTSPNAPDWPSHETARWPLSLLTAL